MTYLEAESARTAKPDISWRDFVIEYHRPEYPFYARGYGDNGEGRFRLEIDFETGKVVSASILKSTTHKTLDDAAVFALRRWRFRPRVSRSTIVAMDFGVTGRPVDEVQRLATYTVEPDLPLTWHHGSGVYRFIVNYETGKVTDVKVIKSTRLPEFDEAVVKAYRQWRFPPHKIRSIAKLSRLGLGEQETQKVLTRRRSRPRAGAMCSFVMTSFA